MNTPMSQPENGKVIETTVAGFPALTIMPQGAIKGHIIFVHGSFAGHASFGPFLERLGAAGYAGTACARRGRSGLPPENCEGITISDYLDDTRKVMDAVGGPVILLGHSLGGLLVQHLAVEGRCKAAVLLASAPPGMLTAQLRTLPALIPHFPRILAGRGFRLSDAGLGTAALSGMSEADKLQVLPTLGPESGKVFRALVLGTGGPRSHRIQCPMFAVCGSDDHIVGLPLHTSTVKAYGADSKVFPGMGHWLIGAPGWEGVADAVCSWLDAVVSKS